MRGRRLKLHWLNHYFFIAVASRVAYILTLILITNLLKIKDFASANCRYDCKWYLGIAKLGYTDKTQVLAEPKSVNWGFFPLFPSLIRNVHSILPLNVTILSILVNSILFMVGVVFLGNYLESKFGRQKSTLTIYLLCFSPVNVYLTSAYSEASFFCFMAVLIWSIERNNIYAVVIAASLLSISRNTGCIIGFLLIVNWQLGKQLNLKYISKAFLISAISNIVLALHIISLERISGDFLAVIHGHGVGRGNPAYWILETLRFNSLLQIGLLGLYIFVIYICIKNLRKRNYTEGLVLIPVIASSAIYPEFINWRYFLILYPIYLEIADSLLLKKSKYFTRIIQVANAVLFILAIFAWVKNYGFMV